MQNLKTFLLQVYFVNVTQSILIFFFFLHKFQGIRSALLSKVLPAVQGICSLLSAKLSYNRHEGISCDDLWLNICQTRDERDEKIKKMKGVAFFSPLSPPQKDEVRGKKRTTKNKRTNRMMKFKKSTGQQLLIGLLFSPPMARAYLPYLCIQLSYKQAWK